MCWNYSLWLGLRSHYWLCLNPFGMKWFCWLGASSINAVLLCLLHSGTENRRSECVYVCVNLSVCSYLCVEGAQGPPKRFQSWAEHQNYFFNLRHAHYPLIQCTLTWFQFEGWCLQVIFSQHGAQIKMGKCNGPASICVSFKAVISFVLIRKHANGSEIQYQPKPNYMCRTISRLLELCVDSDRWKRK